MTIKTMRPKTYVDHKEKVDRKWHLIDLKGKVLGDASVEIARLLMGKHKPTYTPNVDNGDYVVVINVNDVVVTGRKAENKIYYRHSGIPGGFRQETFNEAMEKHPEKIIEHAVKGMLPKNRMQIPRLRRMKAFAGAEHSYKDKFKA